MPRPAITFVQRDFSAGQVTANAERSDDVKLVRKGLKEALNCRLLNPRGYAPRFGRDTIYTDAGRTETVRFGTELQFRITFGDGTLNLRDSTTGDILFEGSGYPWGLTTLHDIVWCSLDREIIVCFQNTTPWVINLRAAISTQISYGAGTVIGNMTRKERAFEGNLDKNYNNSAVRIAANGYVGKTFLTPRTIGKAVCHGTNNFGYDAASTSTTVTLTLYAKQGAAPSSGTDGTQLATTSFADGATADMKELTSSDDQTEFDHAWIYITSNSGAVAIADIALWTGSGSEAWSSAPFAFAQNAVDAVRQPYHKFAQGGVTMTPSATSGSGITGTFSAPVLVADHVGVSFRYGFRELVCTAVTSPTVGTFDVIETLPPTHNVTVASTAGFRVGEIAIGASSDCQALILDITSATVMKCIYLKRYAGFTSSEKIATETAVTTFSSTASTTAAASPVWDEAVFSDVRGWPGSCSEDRNRVIFCDHPLLGAAVAWSAVGSYNDFLPGAAATDAIFEFVPGNVRVRHVAGGPDQFVLSDKGVFYVPISESNPLAPGSVIFQKIGSLAAGSVAPVEMDQGVVFGGSGGNSIIAILPVGADQRPWELRDVSRYHAGLISSLRGLAVQAGGTDSAEQVLWAVNGDGTAVAGRPDPENEWIGFLPVEGVGAIKWISTFGSEVTFNTAYDLGGSDSWVVERLNEDRYIDACIDINDPAPLLAGDEEAGQGPLWPYAGLTVDLMLGYRYLGQREVDENGDLVELPGDDFSAAGIVAGFGFETRARQFVPNIDEGEAKGQRIARRRIRSAMITVRNATEFRFMGRTFAGFKASDAGEGDPPLWDMSFKARSLGRNYDPETVFEKTAPGPCEVLEMSGEVTV